MDLEARTRWIEYSKAKDIMFKQTDIKEAPWFVVQANNNKRARLNCISHLLQSIHYEDLTPEKIELPPRQINTDYKRPPIEEQNIADQGY